MRTKIIVEARNLNITAVRNVVEYLKRKPGCLATYDDLKNFLSMGGSFKKLLKTQVISS